MVAVLALLPVGSALAALFGERTGKLPYSIAVFRSFRSPFCPRLSPLSSPRIFESRTAAADTRAICILEVCIAIISSVCILEVTKRN